MGWQPGQRQQAGRQQAQADAPQQPGGLQALQRLDARQDAGSAYDLLLIDKDMQPLDGFETLRAFRQRLHAAAPPALLLSTVWDADLEQQARAAGFDGVVVKPVTTS